ncbi:MAG: hypothetical protein HRT90_00695 [Candidatus Margulisbacteria bacterium]|nr:hypothetical protein [Candidatus Margulisiibacteriota bacterium]
MKIENKKKMGLVALVAVAVIGVAGLVFVNFCDDGASCCKPDSQQSCTH